MQVYFIDNDDYFRRKTCLQEEDGKFHPDNDERAMFFCRGVLETVKKLGWQPDVIHCHGWLTGIMALYIKYIFSKDPHFKETKVVYSLYNETFDQPWDPRFAEKLAFDGFPQDLTDALKDTSCENLTKVILAHCDGVNIASEVLDANLQALYDDANILKLPYFAEEHQGKELAAFFDKVIDANVLA
jgi:starch synthase